MGSLRTRLFVHLTGGAAVLSLVAGFALTWVIAERLQAEFDRGLLAKAWALAALTELEGDRVEFDFKKERMPEFGDPAEPEYFELWLGDGALLRRSASFELRDDVRRAALVKDAPRAIAPGFRDLRLPDGRWGRQVQIDFVPLPDSDDEPEETPGGPAGKGEPSSIQTVTLIVARERERLDTDLLHLKVGVGVAAVALLLSLAGLAHVALRVGLRSLDRLNHQVRALDVTSLGRRLDLEAPPEEIAVVVEQVNGLLARLEAGFKRERQLSSDIAHELKTPIAELRSLCEVGARWPGDRAAVEAFFEDARAVALQMERVVVHLLALARYDEGREQIWTTEVRVAEEVDAAWKSLARPAAAKRLDFRQRISPALCLDTDPDKFGLMVANILSNAVAYSPPDSAIACTSDEPDGSASVSFSNRADNLEPRDLTVMFDRFWRKDEARGDGHHVGLGLSVVRALADLLAIDITTRLDPDGTFCITLGQKRNCTSAATTQAPSRGPANAGPGLK
jgi:two-component system sensor histidine kinase QseC